VRTLKALVAGVIVGVAAGAGQCAGLVVGMVVGGKAEIVAGATIGCLGGTAVALLLVRRVFASMGALPILKLLGVEALVVGAIASALLMSGASIFEHDAFNPLFLAGPACIAWAIASVWAIFAGPVKRAA